MRFFISQSVRSDYCGVYACAMFLTLIGHYVDRRQARTLFGIVSPRSSFNGVTHDNIASVVSDATPLSGIGWHQRSSATYAILYRMLSRQFSRGGGATIVTFGAVYGPERLRCNHAAVAVGFNQKGIRLLDPLGRNPRGRQWWNVLLRPDQDVSGFNLIKGSFYKVNLAEGAAVFRWKRPPQTTR